MKFVVFVKRRQLTDICDESDDSVLDEYSEYAFDMAHGAKSEGDILIVATMGQSEDVIRFCLDRGADEGFLLNDTAFSWADSAATSKTLSTFVRKFAADYDLIFCGMKARTMQVPAEIAGMLDVPQFYYVEDVELSSGFKVTQNYGDEIRCCIAPKGSVISVSGGSDRIEGLKKSDSVVKVLDRVALGLGLYSVGMKGSKTRVIKGSEEGDA